MMRVPEKYRLKTGVLGSDKSSGNSGVFVIPITGIKQIRCIASDGQGWEHVSVSIMIKGKIKIPDWYDMSRVKSLFWSDEDCVLQFHPPKSEYVNHHPDVLHLWRESGVNHKTPDTILIGIKK